MAQAERSRYSGVAMLFHWVIAVAVIVNWRIAETAEHAAEAARGALIDDHKALGITILVLSLLRVGWRLTHRVPPLPDTMKTWEKLLARTSHVLFYVLLIGLPLGGWLAGSFAGRGIDWFGLFAIPALPVGENIEMAKTIIGFHATGGEIMLYLVVLHVLGALKHSFFDRQGGLGRMLPFGRA